MRTTPMLGRFLLLGAACALLAAPASAQTLMGNGAPADEGTPVIPGWVFTPMLSYAVGYDDNPLYQSVGTGVQGDVLDTIGPGATLTYSGKRTEFDAHYGGGVELYRTFTSLDSYDQNASLYAKHLVTKHLTIYARESYSSLPTTQVLQLVGVPYVRTGSQVEDAQGGLDYQMSKRLSMSANYDFQYVKFDASAFGIALFGGHSSGAKYSLKYQIDDRTALTGEVDAQFATIDGNLGIVPVNIANATGLASNFQTQNASAGFERKLSATLRVYASAGVSHLAINAFGPAQTGPAYSAGLADSFGDTAVNVDYTRSYVPSFGFGGTLQNEEFSAGARRPMTRRIYTSVVFAWMRNQPLIPDQLSLDSLWLSGNVGYVVSRWVRIEAFYAGIHQTIDQPGGVLNHNQFGIQIVTAKPMRIR